MNELNAVYTRICAVAHAGESWPARPVRYSAGKVGLVLLSSGQCTVRAGAGDAAAGGAGSLFLAPVPFTLEPHSPCHCLVAVLEGMAAEGFAAALESAVAQDAGGYPALSGLMLALVNPSAPLSVRQLSALGYELLCLVEPDAPAVTGWPALVQQAVELIRTGYGSIYGVEELADSLHVSKSHLVRVFHQTLGVTPGKYLTDTRIEAARGLLARGHSLEVVATLCGFSGANYLCKVFKKETGMSPAQFRRTVQPAPAPLAETAEEKLFL